MGQFEELTIDQGADVAIEIHLVKPNGQPKNLADHTIQAMMKKTYNSDSDNTYPFTSIINLPPDSGVVVLSMTNTQTDAIKPGRYVYDVELSFVDSDGDTVIERILEGQITVTPSVTR